MLLFCIISNANYFASFVTDNYHNFNFADVGIVKSTYCKKYFK